MANIYVRSTDGVDTDNGSTWALAKATLVGALAIAVAGDTIFVSQAHNETQATAMTLTAPAGPSNLVRIICVDDSAEPPVARATTAQVTTTGASALTFGAGHAYIYGLTFNVGTGATTAACHMANTNNQLATWILEACSLQLKTTAVGSLINVGSAASSTPRGVEVRWVNVTVSFGAAGQAIALGAVRFFWRDTPVPAVVGATLPTTLFRLGVNAPVNTDISGVDFSPIAAARNLFDLSLATGASGTIRMRNCKLGAGVNNMLGVIPLPGTAELLIENCDSGPTNYEFDKRSYQGSVGHELTVVRTGGATDGATPISHKMTTLATGPTIFTPLDGPWISVWNDAPGSKTIMAEIVHDSAVALTDAEVWLEVEALATSGFPLSRYLNDRVADHIFGTPAAQAASTANWTTTGLTTPNKQKLEVTVTTTLKGRIRARVRLAKTNYVVYVDPLLDVSPAGIVGRSYQATGTGDYINETAARRQAMVMIV